VRYDTNREALDWLRDLQTHTVALRNRTTPSHNIIDERSDSHSALVQFRTSCKHVRNDLEVVDDVTETITRRECICDGFAQILGIRIDDCGKKADVALQRRQRVAHVVRQKTQ
jgi:hypothetical protein